MGSETDACNKYRCQRTLDSLDSKAQSGDRTPHRLVLRHLLYTSPKRVTHNIPDGKRTTDSRLVAAKRVERERVKGAAAGLVKTQVKYTQRNAYNGCSANIIRTRSACCVCVYVCRVAATMTR